MTPSHSAQLARVPQKEIFEDELPVAATTVDNLAAEVDKFMSRRMPRSAKERDALEAWARDELSKLETYPGSGISKLGPPDILSKEAARMTMLQRVIAAIEAAAPETKQRAAFHRL